MANAFDYQTNKDGPLKPEIKNFLNKLRDEKGWSYPALSERLGMSPTFLHNLLNKNHNISTSFLARGVADNIAKLLGGDFSGSKAAKEKAENVGSGPSSVLTHSYHLRDDMELNFQLPSDLSEREADRLSQFVRSLAR